MDVKARRDAAIICRGDSNIEMSVDPFEKTMHVLILGEINFTNSMQREKSHIGQPRGLTRDCGGNATNWKSIRKHHLLHFNGTPQSNGGRSGLSGRVLHIQREQV
jgi:hypothetical protein